MPLKHFKRQIIMKKMKPEYCLGIMSPFRLFEKRKKSVVFIPNHLYYGILCTNSQI